MVSIFVVDVLMWKVVNHARFGVEKYGQRVPDYINGGGQAHQDDGENHERFL